ncbi:effector protein, partial [Vibrio parahaemolyticus]|nr:effector protein [Vibrio parahaemolyticus]
FFKDGNIKTASDVLNAFAKLDSKSVQSNSAELNQLAERAMTEAMLETDSGKNLTSLIGESAAKSLAGRVVKDYGGGVSAAQKNPAGSINQMQAVFDMEVMHLKSAQRHIEGLASTDLSQGVYAEGLAEGAFNKSGV